MGANEMAVKRRKSIPKPGQKVTIYSADQKICRGEFTVLEVNENTVTFDMPIGVVQVGDHMYWFENKRKKK